MQRSRLRALAVCGLLVFSFPRAAQAEWHFTPMIGLTFKGATSLNDPEVAAEKRHRNFGGAVSLLGGGVLGAEVVALSTQGFFEGGVLPVTMPVPAVDPVETSRSFALMGNVVLTTPRRWTEYSLRPFVSGGLGLLHASHSSSLNVSTLKVRLSGFNVGVGAVGFLSRRTGLRFDLRYYSTMRRSERIGMAFGPAYLGYMTASVGLVIRR